MTTKGKVSKNIPRFIYKITCIKNNRFYVGQTYDTDKRLNMHIHNAMYSILIKNCIEFYEDIRKYGKENFKIEILDTIEDGEQKLNLYNKGGKLLERKMYASNISESVFIKYYSHVTPELIYNLNDNFHNWAPCSEEKSKKISTTLSDGRLKGENNPMYDKENKHTKETKYKIGSWSRNKTYEELFGKEKAEQIKKKKSKIFKGRKNDKISKALTGRIFSEGHKAKISLAKKGMKFNKKECELCGKMIGLNNFNKHTLYCKNKETQND